MPHTMHLQNEKIESDLDEANMFNIWFASVYNRKQEPGDPFPAYLEFIEQFGVKCVLFS